MYGKDKEPSSILGQITTIKSVYPSNRVHGSLYFFHDTNIQKMIRNRCYFFFINVSHSYECDTILNRFYHHPPTIFPPLFCIFWYFLKTRLILFYRIWLHFQPILFSFRKKIASHLYHCSLLIYSYLCNSRTSQNSQGSIRHQFFVAYRPLLFP